MEHDPFFRVPWAREVGDRLLVLWSVATVASWLGLAALAVSVWIHH